MPADASSTPAEAGTPVAEAPNWDKFISGLDTLNRTLTETNGRLDATSHPDPEPAPTTQADAAPDFEAMSRTELVEWTRNATKREVIGAVSELLRPVIEQQQTTQHNVTVAGVERQIEQAMAVHKDFGDWNDEMIELAKRVGTTLSPNEVYLLARSTNIEKARKLDAKYNPPAPKPAPFALMPGMSGESSKAGKDAKPLDKVSTFNRALDAVRARHPGIFDNLTSN